MVYRKEEIEAAYERAVARLGRTATVAAAHYDRGTGRVVIDFSSGLSMAFKPQDAQGFEHAKPEQLRKIEISPSGLGLHFPVIDADVYLPALLEGFLGSRRWMAARLGRRVAVLSPTPKPPRFARTASSAADRGKFITLPPTSHN